jgi:biopolymer transport protein ExbB
MSDSLSNGIVHGTLVLLVLFSIATWAVVVVKALQGGRARRQDLKLQESLAASRDGLPRLEVIESHEGPTARVALVGVRAWESAGASATTGNVAVSREILELGLRRQIQKERHGAEKGLAILASIGTTAPFVGLFGTVWGILHALKSISGAGSASLDVVAGPVGEALVSTGVGIAVAVPAVLAFNYFVRHMKVQDGHLEDFANALVSAALQSTLPQPRSESQSSESAVAKLSEVRGGALREARA